jgi:uncharacterized LabA/DUF88 family protein
MKPQIGIFVDVQNIYYTTRDVFDRPFDYRKFWSSIEQRAQITVAKAYAIDRNVESQRKFQSALKHIGFDVMLKNFIQRSDGTAKGDWDVGITIDLLEAASELDEIILLSGDGDFAILLDHVIKKYSVKTTVYGVPKLTSDMLIDAADEFVAIDEKLLLS